MLLSKGNFYDEYHHSKPKKHDIIIVTGYCNNRNLDAVEALFTLGYNNIYSFVGGYDEWVRQYSSCGKTPPCDVSCEPSSKERHA